MPHNPRSFCEELNDIFCMEIGIILGAQRIVNPLKFKKYYINIYIYIYILKSGIHLSLRKKYLVQFLRSNILSFPIKFQIHNCID